MTNPIVDFWGVVEHWWGDDFGPIISRHEYVGLGYIQTHWNITICQYIPRFHKEELKLFFLYYILSLSLYKSLKKH